MAPEILENWKVRRHQAAGSVYSRAADVFSATIVVWECVTKQVPYVHARNPVNGYKLQGPILGDHIVAGLRPSSGAIPNGCDGVVSKRMQTLVEKSWHLDPETRWSAAEISAVIEKEIIDYQVLQQIMDVDRRSSLVLPPTQNLADEPNRSGSPEGICTITI